jgi:pimeloyl-ACP methyl ester carboxylesterase
VPAARIREIITNEERTMPTPLLDHVSPVDDTMLDGGSEADLLEHTGARGVLCPFGTKSFAETPVVLVHGINGDPSDLKAIGDYAAARSGMRPWYFLYDDENSYVDRSGLALARFVDELSQKGVPMVAIVAHSMGGIVARCALNFIADRRWFLDPGTDTYWGDVLPDSPAQSLTALRLLAVDVSWHGYLGPASPRGDSIEEKAWHDMVWNSPVFEALYDVALPDHVRIELVTANNRDAGAGDLFDPRCFAELSSSELDAIVSFFRGNTGLLANHSGVWNMVKALSDDADFPWAHEQIQAAVAADELTRERLLEIVRHTIPPIPGSHTSVLRHPWLRHALEGLLA